MLRYGKKKAKAKRKKTKDKIEMLGVSVKSEFVEMCGVGLGGVRL